MSKPVILTGLRANNDLHLGNYLGALLPMVSLQRAYAGKYQINLFVPDLHSFTTPIDHSKLYAQTMHNLKLFVAAGLDLDNSDTHLYRQSFVPAHSELTVILNSFAYMGEMRRMTQFKEKSDQQNNVSVGLFDYPVLMAADILLYGADYVPVGDDQTQHVEIARDLALRLNEKFGQKLLHPPLPVKDQLAFTEQTKRSRIRDLVKPDKKMSKSDASGKGVIFLGDHPAQAVKKIMSATTDSLGQIHYDMQQQPGVSNLLEILSALTGESIEHVAKRYEGKTTYGDLKRDVATVVEAFLSDFQARLLKVDEAKLLAKLQASEQLMNQTANQTLLRVQRAVGLRPASK